MKKAKNVLAIMAILLSVIAVMIVVGFPFADNILAKKSYGDAFASIKPHLKNMFFNCTDLFKFGWFSNIAGHIPELVISIVGLIGTVLFIVLLILMFAKKHVRGLGWWFPMFIFFAISSGVVVGNKFNNAGYPIAATRKLAILGNCATYIAIASGVLLMLSTLFYMIYICKARKSEKKLDSAKEAVIAKIDSLLGGNK